jgi:hypothetical protein
MLSNEQKAAHFPLLLAALRLWKNAGRRMLIPMVSSEAVWPRLLKDFAECHVQAAQKFSLLEQLQKRTLLLAINSA